MILLSLIAELLSHIISANKIAEIAVLAVTSAVAFIGIMYAMICLYSWVDRAFK